MMRILIYTILILFSFCAKSQIITVHELPDSLYAESSSNPRTFDFVIDSSENIWLAIEGGLVKMDSDFNIIGYYSELNSELPHFYCQALAIDINDHVWVGSAGGVLAEFDGNETWTTYSPYYDVTGIEINSQNHVWFHSWNSGIAYYDRTNFHWYNTQNSEIPSDDTYDLEIQDDSIIWIATWDSGLVRFCNGDFSIFDTLNSNIASNKIYSIEIDTNNNIVYCGTDKGISIFDGNNWQKLECVNEKYTQYKYKPLLVDSDNYLWFTYYSFSSKENDIERLLFRYKDNDCYSFSQEELSNISFFSMIEISNNKFALLYTKSVTIIDFNNNIENIDIKGNLSLYPVPATDRLYVDSEDKMIQSISIRSIIGTVIDNYEGLNSDHFEININNITSGLYLLIVDYNDQTQEYKTFIK